MRTTDDTSLPIVRLRARWVWAGYAVVAAAAAVAGSAVVPFAGGYSDGSRLAAIESVGARGTLAIDESDFIGYQLGRDRPPAYDPGNPHLAFGTGDKMFVRGHFYSHHPPVPLVLAGGLYRVALLAGGPNAAERADRFVWGITFATAGLPFVVAVWAVWRIARVTGLSGPVCALLAFSFAFATMAAAYTRQVNGHILLLSVAAVLCWQLARMEGVAAVSSWAWAGLGFTSGLGYCLDGALGPALIICGFAYCYVRAGRRAVVVWGLAAAPWLVAHHGILFAISGNPLSPASDPENWNYPSSVFDGNNLTGSGLKHTPLGTVDYAWRLAFAVRGGGGFLAHNLPLLLAAAGTAVLLIRSPADRRAVGFAAGWVIVGAAPYVLASTDLGGTCLSVRWFLPFLAPGFWIIAMLIRRVPRCAIDLGWLTACGLAVGYLAYRAGPWENETLPWLDVVWTAALLGWGARGVFAPGGETAPAEPL